MAIYYYSMATLALIAMYMLYIFCSYWLRYEVYQSILNVISIAFYSLCICFLVLASIPETAKLLIMSVKFYYVYIQKHVIIGKLKFQNYMIKNKTKRNFLFIFQLYFEILQIVLFFIMINIPIENNVVCLHSVFTGNWLKEKEIILPIILLINHLFLLWIEYKSKKKENFIFMSILIIPAFILSLNITNLIVLYFLIFLYFTFPVILGIMEIYFLKNFLKGVTSFDKKIEKSMKKLVKDSSNNKVKFQSLIGLLKKDESLRKYIFNKKYLLPRKKNLIIKLKTEFNLEEHSV